MNTEMKNHKDKRYIQRILHFEDIIIYGEGIVGKRVLNILCGLGIQHRIKFFAKSQTDFDSYRVADIEVKSIYELQSYYKSALFLLAVSDKYILEVIQIVKQLKIRNYMDARILYDDYMKKNKLQKVWMRLKNSVYEEKERLNFRADRENISATHITYCLSLNAGDTVLSACVRRFLNFRKWEIKSVKQEVDDVLLNEINATDALVIGGGGLFLPDTNANSISGWQWAVRNEQISKIRVPIVIYSVGYNYFWGQELTEYFVSSINCIVEKAVFVGLRNRGSVDAVRRLVSDELKSKIEFQPCISTLIRKLYNVSPSNDSKQVAFNVAFDREELRYGDKREEVLYEIAKAAAGIERMGRSIVYVAHCKSDGEFLPYLDEIGVKYKFKSLTRCLPNEVIHFYRDMEVVIGMRGHAQMIPFGIGVKIISLGGHAKMKWFLSDVNMEECYIDLQTDLNTISSKIIDVFKNITIRYSLEMDLKMKQEQDKLWDISCQNRKKIMQILNEKKC